MSLDAVPVPQPARDAEAGDEIPASSEPVCDSGELACRGSLMARCNARRSDFAAGAGLPRRRAL